METLANRRVLLQKRTEMLELRKEQHEKHIAKYRTEVKLTMHIAEKTCRERERIVTE